jgi:transcriptional regulator with XRE-family HTH domain
MEQENSQVHQLIGTRLRQLRKARRFTLDGLAKSTGFTKSYLSKIENAKKVPPIASLARISEALDTDLAYFFDSNGEGAEQTDDAICLVRADERKHVTKGGSSFGYDYETLAHKFSPKRMEPFLLTFPAHLSKDIHFEHAEEEMFFVLSGRVAFQAGDRKMVLEPGDCVYLGSNVPHCGEALGDKATALVVVARNTRPED